MGNTLVKERLNDIAQQTASLPGIGAGDIAQVRAQINTINKKLDWTNGLISSALPAQMNRLSPRGSRGYHGRGITADGILGALSNLAPIFLGGGSDGEREWLKSIGIADHERALDSDQTCHTDRVETLCRQTERCASSVQEIDSAAEKGILSIIETVAMLLSVIRAVPQLRLAAAALTPLLEGLRSIEDTVDNRNESIGSCYEELRKLCAGVSNAPPLPTKEYTPPATDSGAAGARQSECASPASSPAPQPAPAPKDAQIPSNPASAPSMSAPAPAAAAAPAQVPANAVQAVPAATECDARVAPAAAPAPATNPAPTPSTAPSAAAAPAAAVPPYPPGNSAGGLALNVNINADVDINVGGNHPAVPSGQPAPAAPLASSAPVVPTTPSSSPVPPAMPAAAPLPVAPAIPPLPVPGPVLDCVLTQVAAGVEQFKQSVLECLPAPESAAAAECPPEEPAPKQCTCGCCHSCAPETKPTAEPVRDEGEPKKSPDKPATDAPAPKPAPGTIAPPPELADVKEPPPPPKGGVAPAGAEAPGKAPAPPAPTPAPAPDALAQGTKPTEPTDGHAQHNNEQRARKTGSW